jgi:hypothetical protein
MAKETLSDFSARIKPLLEDICKRKGIERSQRLDKHYGVEGASLLDETKTGADYIEISTWALKAALEEAFIQGEQSGLKDAVKLVNDAF